MKNAAIGVRAAAKVRLENAADRMARALLGMADDDDMPPAVKLAALRDALDRAGLSPKQAMEVEVGIRGFEQTVTNAVRMRRPGDDSEPRVINHQVIEPDRREAQPGDEPQRIANRAQRPRAVAPGDDRYTDDDLPEVASHRPSPPRAVRPATPVDDSLNGVGRASHGVHDVDENGAERRQ